jgi:alpha/beta superfamily hydrolase
MTMRVQHDGETVATSVLDDGSIERAEMRGAPGACVFTYHHVPAGPARGAVIVCSPLHGEFAHNYRREVLLARALTAAGQAVLRFHYRHTGNSDGDGIDLTFDSMREDALAAIDRLRAEAPDGPLTVLGTRWGSLIAAAAAGNHPDAAVVFWEPLLDASRFFKDAFRSQLVREARRGVERPTTSRELEDRLRAGEGVDVIAHRLEPALYRSCIDRSLEAELGPAPRRLLVVQVGPTGSVRPDVTRLAERWRAGGSHVETMGLKGDETWWLIEERGADETDSATDALIEVTTAWVAAGSEARP